MFLESWFSQGINEDYEEGKRILKSDYFVKHRVQNTKAGFSPAGLFRALSRIVHFERANEEWRLQHFFNSPVLGDLSQLGKVCIRK